MSRPCCVLCGQDLKQEDRDLAMDNGPVCRACRVLAGVRSKGYGPVFEGRQPETPRYQPGRSLFLPLPLAPQAVLSLS